MALVTVLNGKPRGPQADKLYEHVKKLIDAKQYGAVVAHEDIEGIIGVTRAAERGRYQGIVAVAFKRIWRETGFVMKTQVGLGYQIPFGADQLRLGIEGTHRSRKRWARSIATVGTIEDGRLSEQDRKVRDHTVIQGNAILDAMARQTKELSLKLGKRESLPPPK